MKHLQILQEVGKSLHEVDFAGNNYLQSPQPLALALLEGFHLYSELLSSENSQEKLISFNANEYHSPNLYSRLKFIRDLCSASEYSCREALWLTMIPNKDRPPLLLSSTFNITKDDFLEILTQLTKGPSNSIIEVANALDDILESLLNIAIILRDAFSSNISQEHKSEVHRHILHICEHFDYAETSIINILESDDSNN